jgi:hypothetical protein
MSFWERHILREELNYIGLVLERFIMKRKRTAIAKCAIFYAMRSGSLF